MTAFIVAVEYRGQDAGGQGSARVPTCQHAYDLDTASLAGHRSGARPRVAFPVQQRAWNADPLAVRCPDCDAAVEQIVRDLIGGALLTLTHIPPRPNRSRAARTDNHD